MQKTSKQWVEEVSKDPVKLQHWLERQYIGEELAARRLQELCTHPDLTDKQRPIITRIAEEERLHSQWIAKLLPSLPEVSYDEDRYWSEVKLSELSLDELLAAGHHAEEMRLERIQAVVDSTLPNNIREVFAKILPMEKFHAKAFGSLASEDALAKTEANHIAGMQALNLIM